MLWHKLVLILLPLLDVHIVDSHVGGWNVNRASQLTLHPKPVFTKLENHEKEKNDVEQVITTTLPESLLQPEQQGNLEKSSDTSQSLPERRVYMPRPLPEPARVRVLPSLRSTSDVDQTGWNTEIEYSLDPNNPPRVKPAILSLAESAPILETENREPESILNPELLPSRTLALQRLKSIQTEIMEQNPSSPKDETILTTNNNRNEVEKEETVKDVFSIENQPSNEHSLKKIEGPEESLRITNEESDLPSKALPPRRLWSSRPLIKPTTVQPEPSMSPVLTTSLLRQANTDQREPKINVIEKQEFEFPILHESKLIEPNPQQKVIDKQEPTFIERHKPEIIDKIEAFGEYEPVISEEEKLAVNEEQNIRIIEDPEKKVIKDQQPEVQDPEIVEKLEPEVEPNPKVAEYLSLPQELKYRETLESDRPAIVSKDKPLSMTNPSNVFDETPSSVAERRIYRQRLETNRPPPPVQWPQITKTPGRIPIPITTPQTKLPSLIPKSPLQPDDELQLIDYECKATNAYYSVQNDCDNYVECKKYMAYMNTCPDGLHFNRNAVWPEYPCSYPWEVECQANSVEREPEPTSECPHQFGFFAVPDDDCSTYIMCQDGKANIMNCPPGLVFNNKESACDWPINVPSCQPKVFQGFTCPVVSAGEDEDIIYKFRHGDSCKDYVACQHGRPRLLSCDIGLAFDAESQVCVDADYVDNCRNN